MKSLALLPFCACLCTGSAPAQETLQPPTFQPGFEYVIRSRQVLETVLGAGLPDTGKQMVGVALELVAQCRTSPAAPDQRDISIRLAQVSMNVLMGGIRATYDSTQPDSGETLLGQTFGSVIGKSFQVTVDSHDRVASVRGQEEFAAQKSPLAQQIGVSQLIQSAMPMLTLGVPEAGAAPGQSWDHVKDSSMGPAGKLKAAYHVTYTGDENGTALLRYQARLGLDSESAGAEEASKKRVSIEDGILNGTMKVDKAKRFPCGGSGEGSLTMKMPNPADAAQTLQLPIVQRRSFELVRMRALQ